MLFSGFRGAAAGALAVIVLSFQAHAVFAQGAGAGQGLPAPLAVVVDTVEALNSSKAMVGVREQYGRFEGQFRAQVAADEKVLNDTAKDLERVKTTLGQDAFVERSRSFEKSVMEYRRKSTALRVALEKSNRQAVNQVQQVMIDLIGEIAQQRGANVVLSKTQVILYDPRMEITQQVVEALNRKLPSVSFPTPVPEAEAAAPTSSRPTQPATKKK